MRVRVEGLEDFDIEIRDALGLYSGQYEVVFEGAFVGRVYSYHRLKAGGYGRAQKKAWAFVAARRAGRGYRSRQAAIRRLVEVHMVEVADDAT